MGCIFLYDGLHLCGTFAQSADAAVHQVAHALVVYAHDLADVLIFLVLHVVEVDYLALPWRQLVEEFLHVGCEGCLAFDVFLVEFLCVSHRSHAGVVDFVVAKTYVAAELVVDSVAERDVEVALYIFHAFQHLAFGEQLYEHVVDAVFYHLTVA